MKTCPHCKVNVGGKLRACPLCQSPLLGKEDEEYYWPDIRKKKKQSLFIKILLFFLWASYCVCFAMDFLIIESTHKHWSILLLIWLIVGLLTIRHFNRSHNSVPKIILLTMIILSGLVSYTGYFVGFFNISVNLVVPILCSATLISNFVFSFINAGFTENALVCIFCNILLGVVPYIALFIHDGHAPLPWTIALLISVITFIGLIIFKGRIVLTEIHKRLHI